MVKRKIYTLIVAAALIFVAAIAYFKIFIPKTRCAEAVTGAYPVETVESGFALENNGKLLTGFTLPAEIKGDFKLIIPDTVETIAASSLSGAGDVVLASRLVGVKIPASVTLIGDNAFAGSVNLTEIVFAERTQKLIIGEGAFSGCRTGILNIPANTEIRSNAFVNCNLLAWVYAGGGVRFINTAADDGAKFFPDDTNLTIIFPDAAAYEGALAQSDTIFKTKHGDAVTYIVRVNCYIGNSATPVVYERLHGKSFNFVREDNGVWHADSAFSKLPAQAENYASTVWYGEKELQNKKSYEQVNGLLATAAEINLYCYETVASPALPAEPATWVYNDKVAYDINKLSEVLKAMGCAQTFTDKQLSAMNFSVVYADTDSNVSDRVPPEISENGIYSVTVALNPEYGVWNAPVASTITINVNMAPFNAVLIAFLVLCVIAAGVSVCTTVIRKRVHARTKKRQLSQQYVLEKYRAVGGETTLE